MRHRAVIPPRGDVTYPAWSVMIPTYNCALYLRHTLAGVLAQDPGPDAMQIEVIDDHSTRDDPAAVVEELGRGRVTFYRQPANVGSIRNFDTCLLRSRGRLVHLLHGDDCVRDGFYRTMRRPFDEHAEIGAAFCRQIMIDEDGHWQEITKLEQCHSGILPNWVEKIARGQRLTPPGIVVRRTVYEHLGGFDQRISCYGEDWEMWVRIAAHYPIWHEVEPLALYRVKRRGSLSRAALHTAADIRDMRLATDIVESYLPERLPAPRAHELVNQARNGYARWAMTNARELFIARDVGGGIAQLRAGLACSRSPDILWGVGRLIAWAGMRWARWVTLRRVSSARGKDVGHLDVRL